MDLFNHIAVLTTILLVYKIGLFKCDFDLKTTNNSGLIQNEVQTIERQTTQVIDLSRMYLPPKQVINDAQRLRNNFNAPSGFGNNCGSGILDQGKFEPTASVEKYDYASSNLANSESNGVNTNKKNSPGNSGEYSSAALEESDFGEKINKNYNNGRSDFSGNNYNLLSRGSPQSRVGLNNGYAQNQGPVENSFGKQQSISGSHAVVEPTYNAIDKNYGNHTKTNNRSTAGNTQRNSFERSNIESISQFSGEHNSGNSYDQTSFVNNNNQNRKASPHSQIFDSKGSSSSSHYGQGVANPQLSNVQNFKSPNFLLGSSEYSTGVNGGNQGNFGFFNQRPVGLSSNNGYDQNYRDAGSIIFPGDSQYGKSSGSSSLDSYGQSKLPQSITTNGQNYRNNRWGQSSDNNHDASTNILKAYNQQRLTASFDLNNKNQSIPQQFSKNIGSNYRSSPSSPTSVRYSQEHKTPVNSNLGRLPNLWFNMPLISSQPSDRTTDNSVRNTKKYSTLVPKDRYQNSNMPGQSKNSYEPLNNDIGNSESSLNSFSNFVPGSVLSIQISNNNSPGQGKSVHRLSNNNGGYEKPGSSPAYGEPGSNSFSNFAPGNIPNSQNSNTNSQGKYVYGPSNSDGGGYGEPGPNSLSNFAPGNEGNSQSTNTKLIEQGKKVYGPSINNNGGYGEPGPNSFSNFAPGNTPNSQSSNTNSIEQGKQVYGPSINNNGGYGVPGPNSFSNFAPGNVGNSQTSNTHSLEQRENDYRPSNDHSGYGEPGPNSFSNFAPDNLPNRPTSNTNYLEQGNNLLVPANNGHYGEPGPNSFPNFEPSNLPTFQSSSNIDCDSSELEPSSNQQSDASFYFSSSGY